MLVAEARLLLSALLFPYLIPSVFQVPGGSPHHFGGMRRGQSAQNQADLKIMQNNFIEVPGGLQEFDSNGDVRLFSLYFLILDRPFPPAKDPL